MLRNQRPTSALVFWIGPRESTSMRVGKVSELIHSSASRPPYIVTPSTVPPEPSAPDPVYARAKSPIAPARIVGNTDLLFRLPGGTTSGSCTLRGSLHPVTGSASAASRRSCDALFIVGSLASEGQVDPGDEVPHRRLGQELGRVEVRLAGVVQLGIDTAVVGPRRQVTPRDRDAERARADMARDVGRREVGEGQLPQLHEARFLEVPRFEAIGDGGDGAGLLGEWRCRITPAAADTEQTAELLRAVVEPISEPTVEQSVQSEVFEEADLGAEGAPVSGERRALIRFGSRHGDLGSRDDAVAIRIVEGVRAAPIAAQRIAGLMTLCGTAQPEDDRRDPGAEVDETVAVAPGAGGYAPREVRRVQDLGVEGDLYALVADLTQVLEPRGAHAQRPGEPPCDECVARILVVVGELHMQSLVPKVGIEPGLILPRLLRLEIRVPEARVGDARRVGAVRGHRNGAVERDGIRRAGLTPALPPCGPHTERAQEGPAREERLLGNHPRAG